MNGKTVEIDNTDAEGRLILAGTLLPISLVNDAIITTHLIFSSSDALYYTSSTYKPHTLVDVATLTGAVQVALGEVYSGVFSVCPHLLFVPSIAVSSE